MSEFLVVWHRVLNDQDASVLAKQRRRIFYKKIKDSGALHGYLDYYRRLEDGHEDWSCDYLLRCMNMHIKRTCQERNLSGIIDAQTMQPSALMWMTRLFAQSVIWFEGLSKTIGWKAFV